MFFGPLIIQHVTSRTVHGTGTQRMHRSTDIFCSADAFMNNFALQIKYVKAFKHNPESLIMDVTSK
jgi:hypothetical protein